MAAVNNFPTSPNICLSPRNISLTKALVIRLTSHYHFKCTFCALEVPLCCPRVSAKDTKSLAAKA